MIYPTYTTSTDIYTGSFIYLPERLGDACPHREYSMQQPDLDWKPVIHNGIWSINEERKEKSTIFEDHQVRICLQNLLDHIQLK